MLKEGSKAPDFCLKDAGGNDVCLKDLKGQKLVIYFYPKDNTPGCTIEALAFTALDKDFQELGVKVVGVSKDSCESHQKFIEKKGLTISLLSDPDSAMQKKYKVWRPKKFMGREFMGTVRSTYLLGEDGKVLKTWDNVRAKGHAEKVLEFCKGL